MGICAGIGGLELGVARAVPQYRTICAVERELTAVAVLAARQREGRLAPFPIWDDVGSFDGKPWRGVVDIVLGGYPCQPFSYAGKRQGTADPRWLWADIRRIVQEAAPALCFFENVPGHLRHGFEQVRDDLRAMGYEVAAGLFSAEEVGAPHRRERLFILAQRADIGREWLRDSRRGRDGLEDFGSELADAGHGAGGSQLRQQQEERASGVGERGKGVGDTGGRLTELSERQRTRPGYQEGGRTSGEPDRSGYPLRWPPGPSDSGAWARILALRPDLAPATSQPEVRGMAHGAARRLDDLTRADKLRLLGNSVVPAQAELAFRTLMSLLELTPEMVTTQKEQAGRVTEINVTVRPPSFSTLHPGSTSAQVMEDILTVHGRPGMTVLDLTWGRGTFWDWAWEQMQVELYGADLHTEPSPEDLEHLAGWVPELDCRDAPNLFGAKTFDVVVFDPPFAAIGPSSDKGEGDEEWSKRYGSSRVDGGPKNYDQVAGLTVAGVQAACELARELVIVKCQPVVESGLYRDTPHLVRQELLRAGWHAEDAVWLYTQKRPQPGGRTTQHFRNVMSQFVVGKPGKGGLREWAR